MAFSEIEAAVESILFAAGDPVGVERLCLALEISRADADAVCRKIADRYRYERRGIRLVKLGTAYQLCSAPEHADAVRKALEARRPAKLSQTALEVLAIVAYFQPITRADIDQIRGVDSSYTVSMLAERDLIEEAGRLAVPGRPIQYRTSQTFLRTFHLSGLEDLPDLPGVSAEDGQVTMDMETRLAKLRTEQQEEETVGP